MAAVPLLKAYGSRTKCSRYGVTAFPFQPAGVWSLSFYRCGHPGHHYCGSSPQAVPGIFQKHPPCNRFWFSVFPYYPSFLRSTLSIHPHKPFSVCKGLVKGVAAIYPLYLFHRPGIAYGLHFFHENIHFPFFHILPPGKYRLFCIPCGQFDFNIFVLKCFFSTLLAGGV